MVSRGQIKIVHLAKNSLGLSDEEYREVLLLYGGVKSSKALSPEGFFRLMEHFRELGFMPRAEVEAETSGRMIEMVTPAQRAKIRQLERELGWADNPARLEGFLRKRLRIRRVLTKEQAIKAIEALKAMLSREKPTAGTGS